MSRFRNAETGVVVSDEQAPEFGVWEPIEDEKPAAKKAPAKTTAAAKADADK